MPTTDPGRGAAAVPQEIRAVGTVLSALLREVRADGTTEHVVLVRRGDVTDRPYATLIAVAAPEADDHPGDPDGFLRVAQWGNYDLTWEQAVDDLLERAGIVPPVDDAR